MKICDISEHLNAKTILASKNALMDEINTVLNYSELQFGQDKPQYIKKAINERFNKLGWTDRVKVRKRTQLTISYMKNKVGVCFQLGNVARTYADLLKLAVLAKSNIIDVGIIIVPDMYESKLMGANYANYERLSREIKLFKDILEFPLLLISISN